MGDITRSIVAAHARALDGSREASVQLEKVLQFLEDAMRSGDASVQELIAVSFLENLEQGDPHFSDLRGRFGDALVAELRAISDQ